MKDEMVSCPACLGTGEVHPMVASATNVGKLIGRMLIDLVVVGSIFFLLGWFAKGWFR